MAKYIIEGGNKLKGKVKIYGNKNSILPCLAACLLTEEEVILKNVPQIADVEVMIQILQTLGAEVQTADHKVTIRVEKIKTTILPHELVSKLRASLLLVGPLLARMGKVEFSHPGGDIIGRRGFEVHLNGFQDLGYKVGINDREYKITKSKNVPFEARIFLEVASVTGTENLILVSVTKKGTTIIRNAAQEPHVVDLCNMLNSMGARIEGIGSQTLKIDGVNQLTGTDFTIGSDNIEFGTYAAIAAITGGEIEIENCECMDIEPILWPLKKMGLMFDNTGGSIKVSAGKLMAIPRLVTNQWPGFPTDLLSIIIVLSTQAKGVSLLHDWIYESRMFFVDKLISMGANITIADPHRVLVYGPSKLNGRNLETPDIRAGMALVLAALAARGRSIINRAELIERGYEGVVLKLGELGASIERLD